MDHPEALLTNDEFVRRLARRLVRDVNDAEDAAQNTWLAALERGDARRSPLRRWLATVLRNSARQMRRASARRILREQAVARPERVDPTIEVVEREAARREVLDALLALPDGYRTPILLRFYENLSHRDAAHRMGVPLETFRTRLKRGLDLLRAELDRKSGGRPGACAALLAHLASIKSPRPLGTESSIRSRLQEGPVMPFAAKLAALIIALSSIAYVVWPASRTEPRHDTPAAHGAAPALATGTQGSDSPSRATLDSSIATDRARDHDRSNAGPGSGATIIVQATRQDDQSPATMIPLTLRRLDSPQVHLVRQFAVTDEDGTGRFENVAAGRWELAILGGPLKLLDAIDGAEQEFAVTIPRGFEIQGLVVDAEQSPVPNADIVLGSGPGVGRVSQVVTQTASDGTFTLHDAADDWIVAARTGGRAPAAVHLLSLPHEGETISVRLALPPAAGGRLEGTVVSPEGTPIAGAIVLVGANADLVPPLRVTTDAAGAFAADGLAPGSTPLLASAPDWATCKTTAVVNAGGESTTQITIRPGATVRGRVTNTAGAGESQAVVYADLAADLERDDFALRITTANLDGDYVLEHVSEGTIALRAQGGGADRTVTTTLALEDGQIADWNPVMSVTQTIRGRLLDPRGAPLSSWILTALSKARTHDFAAMGAFSDEQGDFTFESLAPGKYLVLVNGPKAAPGAGVPFPCFWVDDVDSGASGLVITLPDSARPTARVTGIVTTPEGTPPGVAAAHARAELPISYPGLYARIDVATGAFSIGPLPPGLYHVKVSVTGFQPLDAGERSLAPDQVLDLGTLTLTR